MVSELPIDAHLPALVDSLAARPNLVLVAEPGAGKTTRLPPALLSAAFLGPGSARGSGEILVLEPRRIAARMAARRVASELGERLGERVGYMVRFERVVSERTRLIFLTEALLTRRLLDDRALSGVSCVVLDEFHERSLHTDLGLALLRRLQQSERPDLRIVVMSATLDAERLAAFLDAPIVRVPGRTFPVDVEYLERPDERRLEEQVRAAVRRLLVRGLDGDVLVFLPGAAEIRRAHEACGELTGAFDVELATLHGDLSPAEQDRALERGKRRKIVLSTNIAETSLTLEGVAAVVDCGLARVASHSPWSGLNSLSTAKISQASAIQRMGRAGRVRAGLCLRLYTRADFEARARFDAPEIAQSDLCETELFLRALLGSDERTLAFLDAPPAIAREQAVNLLSRLGALNDEGGLSTLGRKLLDMPIHPRIGRFALALSERGFVDEAATLGALLSEREPRLSLRTSFKGAQHKHDDVGESDLLARFDAFEQLGGDASAQAARRAELDFGVVRSVVRLRDQLARSLRRVPRAIDQEFESAVRVCTMLAFPDRVARRRSKNGSEVVLSEGGSASLAESSVVKEAEFLVAFEAEERGKSAASGSRTEARASTIRGASSIEPEWLLEHFPARVKSELSASFDAKTQRIESRERMVYDALVLDETQKSAARGREFAELLASAALARGPAAPWDTDAVEQWQRRSQFAAGHDESIPPIDEAALRAALIAHCEDKLSFEELSRAPFEQVLPELVDPSLRQKLMRLAPASIKLPSGRELKVHYELDRPPWVESRLQDFFGALDGPRLANGKVPLVLHLLAPNQRPVQVTTDLKGFWERHYQGIRKELMRRYPRHSWPEDPKTAEPPPPKRR